MGALSRGDRDRPAASGDAGREAAQATTILPAGKLSGVSPAFRKGSFLDRVANGGRARDAIPPIDTTFFRGPTGVPALFKPEQVQRAYGDNVHLYRAVLTISMEIGSTHFKLKKPKANGEFDYVLRHQ